MNIEFLNQNNNNCTNVTNDTRNLIKINFETNKSELIAIVSLEVEYESLFVREIGMRGDYDPKIRKLITIDGVEPTHEKWLSLTSHVNIWKNFNQQKTVYKTLYELICLYSYDSNVSYKKKLEKVISDCNLTSVRNKRIYDIKNPEDLLNFRIACELFKEKKIILIEVPYFYDDLIFIISSGLIKNLKKISINEKKIIVIACPKIENNVIFEFSKFLLLEKNKISFFGTVVNCKEEMNKYGSLKIPKFCLNELIKAIYEHYKYKSFERNATEIIENNHIFNFFFPEKSMDIHTRIFSLKKGYTENLEKYHHLLCSLKEETKNPLKDDNQQLPINEPMLPYNFFEKRKFFLLLNQNFTTEINFNFNLFWRLIILIILPIVCFKYLNSSENENLGLLRRFIYPIGYVPNAPSLESYIKKTEILAFLTLLCSISQIFMIYRTEAAEYNVSASDLRIGVYSVKTFFLRGIVYNYIFCLVSSIFTFLGLFLLDEKLFNFNSFSYFIVVMPAFNVILGFLFGILKNLEKHVFLYFCSIYILVYLFKIVLSEMLNYATGLKTKEEIFLHSNISYFCCFLIYFPFAIINFMGCFTYFEGFIKIYYKEANLSNYQDTINTAYIKFTEYILPFDLINSQYFYWLMASLTIAQFLIYSYLTYTILKNESTSNWRILAQKDFFLTDENKLNSLKYQRNF